MTRTTQEASIQAMRSNIQQTRASMAASVNIIEERFSPAVAKQQLAELKQTAVAEFHDAKEQIKHEIALDLAGAKSAIDGEIRDVKTRITEEYENVKTAAYDATVGKVNTMVTNAREVVSNAGDATMSAVRDNPVPVALIALGTGWLVMEAVSARRNQAGRGRFTSTGNKSFRSQAQRPQFDDVQARKATDPRYEYKFDPGQGRADRDARPLGSAEKLRFELDDTSDGNQDSEGLVARAGDAADDARRYVGQVVSDVGASATKLAHKVGDNAVQLGSDARGVGRKLGRDAKSAARSAGRQVVRAEKAVERGYEANPLAFGAAAVAAGALVGLAVPYSKREDQWLGSTKDKLLASAHGAARDVIESAEGALSKAVTEVDAAVAQAADSAALERTDPMQAQDWFSGDRKTPTAMSSPPG